MALKRIFKDAEGTLVLWSGLTKQTKCFFWPKEQKKAEEWLKGKADVYFGVCLQKEPPETGRGTKDNISRVPALWADIDVQNEKRKAEKKYAKNIDEVLRKLQEFPMPPTLTVDSGGGIHAYWVLKEPIDVETYGVREAEYLVEYLQHALKQYLQVDIDATHDLTRVLRPPGSVNSKYGKTVKIISQGLDYDLSDILDGLDMFTPPPRTAVTEADGVALDFEVRQPKEVQLPLAKYQSLLMADPLVSKTMAHDRPDLADQSLSGYDLSLATRAAQAGWSAQEICDLLVTHRDMYGQAPKAKSYYEITIKHALSAAEQAKKTKEPAEKYAFQNLGKDGLLERLSEALGVNITHIYKYSTYKQPQYWLEANGQRIALPGVQGLIEQWQLRRAIAAATGRYIPPMGPKIWANVAQALLDACEEVDVGAEASSDKIRVLLEDYLATYPPAKDDDWEDAAAHNLPFCRDKDNDEIVYFSLRHFALHIWQTSGERIRQGDIAAELRRLGYEPKVMAIRAGKISTTRYVWTKVEQLTLEIDTNNQEAT